VEEKLRAGAGGLSLWIPIRYRTFSLRVPPGGSIPLRRINLASVDILGALGLHCLGVVPDPPPGRGIMKNVLFRVESEDQGKRLDRYLALRLGRERSRMELKRLIERRGVLLNGERVHRASKTLRKNDSLKIELEEDRSSPLVGEDLPFAVVFEDPDFLVVNKESGQVVHPGPGHGRGTLVHALVGKGHCLSSLGGSQRPGIVHRLDKETSGLLMIAKNNRAHRKLSSMLKARAIRKFYIALVTGRVRFDEGRIDEPVGRHPRHRLRMTVRPEGRIALTEYRVLERFRQATLLEVRPITGRTHQIRTHCAHIGHPVIGDVLYGYRGRPARLALHAARLEFDHPVTGRPVRCEAPLPLDLAALVEEERRR